MIKGFERKPKEFAENVRKAAENSTLAELTAKAREEKDPLSAYAAVYLAVRDGIGLTPFGSQIIAGGYLDDANIAELATGEGKTVAAVFAAYMSVCRGEHIHILTFNDYLAKRDREWMKPAYDLLGVSTAYITEKTPREERRTAYRADVLYSTVKECGFDFLRDFLVFDPAEAVGNGYERVIVDEADSLLIDEARIPLIAAGIMDIEKDEELPAVFEFAKTLEEGDYDTDEGSGNAFLTRSGERKAEEHFGIDNIYSGKNNALLTRLNECLNALFVYAEDKDYIVRDGQIRIIDAFTGRTAEDRCYPGFLQPAIELKHGLDVSERGVVMGSIPIQFFIRQYSHVSGMTGTAMTAREEFDELYGLVVKPVEPNTPSIRTDLPMAVYYDENSKLKAIVREVREAHDREQPVLIGTANIAQSERLSALLTEAGIEHSVLNAKNDEEEAEIIKGAGMPGAVTVSTNMAGRGVDIKLGGSDEMRRSEAVAAGGLYAIGTFMAESARINDQLRGRAARQGDPGQSRLFVSLDEPIMTVYKLKKHIPSNKYPEPTEDEITEKSVVKEVARIQKISQGKKLDERVRLLKLTMIGEKHRDQVFESRQKYLTGEKAPTIWQDEFPELYEKAVEKYGEEKVAEKQLEYVLAKINMRWSAYLEFATWFRESIHLRAIGGENPADEYNIGCEQYYDDMGGELIKEMGEGLEELIGKSPDGLKIPRPKRISTYLLEDTGDEFERRTLAEFVGETIFGEIDEEEFEEYYAGDAELEEAEDDMVPEKKKKEEKDGAEDEEKPAKQGFFSKLFGKNKK